MYILIYKNIAINKNYKNLFISIDHMSSWAGLTMRSNIDFIISRYLNIILTYKTGKPIPSFQMKTIH